MKDKIHPQRLLSTRFHPGPFTIYGLMFAAAWLLMHFVLLPGYVK